MLQAAYRQEVLDNNILGEREAAIVVEGSDDNHAHWSDGVMWEIPAAVRSIVAGSKSKAVLITEVDHKDGGKVILKEVPDRKTTLLRMHHKHPEKGERQVTQLVVSTLPEVDLPLAYEHMKSLTKEFAAGASKLDINKRKVLFKVDTPVKKPKTGGTYISFYLFVI